MRAYLIAGVMLAALSAGGCSSKSKAVADLPPPPASAAVGEELAGTTDGVVGSVTAPGSHADLIAKAGADRVFFEYDSYTLSDEARALLGRQATWLRANPSAVFTVEGHADERGTREYNLALGDRRANAVKNFLAAQGIAVQRLRTISYGRERPEMQGSDEQSYAQNRRAVSVVASGDVS